MHQRLVRNCGGKGNVLIYPTKSKGRFNIELAPGFESAKILVINSVGQEVATNVSTTLSRKLNLQGFASGIYLVQVINNNKMIEKVRIVIAQ